MMTKFEERRDNELKQIAEEEEEETKMSLSEMLDKRRADALAKEEAAERADQMDALDKQFRGPIKAQDLQRKLGGETTSPIDRFFSNDDTGEN
jgi:hypothetical protein